MDVLLIVSLIRLREYELNLPNSNRGPDVGRVYFVILEMSRKIFFLCYMI